MPIKAAAKLQPSTEPVLIARPTWPERSVEPEVPAALAARLHEVEAAVAASTTIGNLLALIVDPAAFQARLREIEAATAAMTKARELVVADRAAFEAYERTVRAELTAAVDAVRERQAKVFADQNEVTRRREALQEQRKRLDARDMHQNFSAWSPPAGSGLTRE
jgi:hypothetical protein